MVKPEVFNPPEMGPAKGYAHSIKAGDLLFLAGQIGGEPLPDGRHRIVSPDLVAQFARALENVLAIVRAAGGSPESVVEMTVYVTDMAAYREGRPRLGEAWKRLMGRHYPAMTLVEVADLYETGALVEIRAVALVG